MIALHIWLAWAALVSLRLLVVGPLVQWLRRRRPRRQAVELPIAKVRR